MASSPSASTPATHAQYLHAAYLLNDVGTAHHLQGQLEQAMELYTQSLQLRSEAIDVAVASAQSGHGAAGGEERTEEEMEFFLAQLRSFLENADAQGLFAEARCLQLEAEPADTLRQAEIAEEIRFLPRPMRIVGCSVWTSAASQFSPGGADAAAVTLHNMSLLHYRMRDLDRALQVSEMAMGEMADDGSDTELCRAVVLSNRAYLARQSGVGLDEGVAELLEEAAAAALAGAAGQAHVREVEGFPWGQEDAMDVVLNAVGAHLKAGRGNDALALCRHVAASASSQVASSSVVTPSQGTSSSGFSRFGPDFDLSSSSTPGPSQDGAPSNDPSQCNILSHISIRASLLLASSLHFSGAKLYHSGDLSSALCPLVRSLHLRSTLLGESHPSSTAVMYLLGRLLHDREEYVDALGMYERAMSAQVSIAAQAQAKAEDPNTGARAEVADLLNTMCNITKVHLVRGSLDLAMAVCTDALNLSKTRFLAGDTTLSEFIVVLLHMKGSISQEMGDGARAMKCFTEAVRLAQLSSEDGEGGTRLPPLINMGGLKNGVGGACPGAAAA